MPSDATMLQQTETRFAKETLCKAASQGHQPGPPADISSGHLQPGPPAGITSRGLQPGPPATSS